MLQNSLECKFTPMEFETPKSISFNFTKSSANLLRWSLKLVCIALSLICLGLCKFTPMEFETHSGVFANDNRLECKFTPMEFETILIGRLYVLFLKCKFTPMEFETSPCSSFEYFTICANLLRWSLKLARFEKSMDAKFSVQIYSDGVWNRVSHTILFCAGGANLLRWSLKLTWRVL